MKQKKYPTYKPSGVEWIGEVPDHWKVVKFYFITKLMTCGHASTPNYVDEGGYMFLSAQNIKEEKISLFEYRNISDELHFQLTKNHKVEKGDLLQVRVGGESTIGQTAVVEIDDAFSIYVSLTHIKLDTSSVYNYYVKNLCNSTRFKEYCGVVMKRGAGVANLNVSDLQTVKIPLPPLYEQKAIAYYLEKKAALIDSAIRKKEKLIELLQEEKTAIINHAVTRGLDPNVKMKDSGVEWLGEIPEHWDVKRLKHVTDNIQTGSTPPTSEEIYYEDGTFNWYSPGDFNETFELVESTRKITLEAVESGVVKTYPKYTVLVVSIGATIGKSALCLVECSSNQQVNAVSFSDTVDPWYGLFYFRTIQTFFKSLSNSATLPIVNQSQMKELLFPVPPLEEQKRISAFIKDFNSKFETTALQLKRTIEYLQEYRTALINEVVTGKRCVI